MHSPTNTPCQPVLDSFGPPDARVSPQNLHTEYFKNPTSHGLSSETMAKKTGSKGEDLTELPGVGAATAKKLRAAGLNTAAKIAKAGKTAVSYTHLTLPTKPSV